jgi:hypothetical protein
MTYNFIKRFVNTLCQICDIVDAHNGVAADSNLLGCDNVSLVSDILKDSGGFVFQCQVFQEDFLLGMPDPEDGGSKIIFNGMNRPPNYTVSYPKVLDSSTSNIFAYLKKTNKVTIKMHFPADYLTEKPSHNSCK